MVYVPVLLVDRADGVRVNSDPDARLQGLEQLEVAPALDDLGQLRDLDRRRAQLRRVAVPGQNCDMRVARDEVGQQLVTLLDDVVVVRNRLAGFDCPVLGSGLFAVSLERNQAGSNRSWKRSPLRVSDLMWPNSTRSPGAPSPVFVVAGAVNVTVSSR